MPEEKNGAKTEYHVLKLSRGKRTAGASTASSSAADADSLHDHYALVAENVSAHSSDHAIRVFVEKAEIEGVYIAVPARSWKPQPVKVETTKTVKVGV